MALTWVLNDFVVLNRNADANHLAHEAGLEVGSISAALSRPVFVREGARLEVESNLEVET